MTRLRPPLASRAAAASSFSSSSSLLLLLVCSFALSGVVFSSCDYEEVVEDKPPRENSFLARGLRHQQDAYASSGLGSCEHDAWALKKLSLRVRGLREHLEHLASVLSSAFGILYHLVACSSLSLSLSWSWSFFFLNSVVTIECVAVRVIGEERTLRRSTTVTCATTTST